MILLDTDVMIDFQRQYPPALAWFASLPEIPHIAGFVAMELLQDARNRDELKRSLKLLATLRLIWPTESECGHALYLFSKYHLSHHLGMIDASLPPSLFPIELISARLTSSIIAAFPD